MSGPVGRKPRVTDDELIEAIEAVIGESDAPVAKTADIADRVPIGERGALKRLRSLEEEDRVGSLEVSSGRVWWLPDR